MPGVARHHRVSQLQGGRSDEQILKRNRDGFGLLFAVDLPDQQAVCCVRGYTTTSRSSSFTNSSRRRTWAPIPILVGAERLWPADRAAIEQAFGPAFETYGCREVMLVSSECDAHAGMHVSMEAMIVELIVRDGTSTRAARPGETGEVVLTDLHNLACPMIRYVNGDLAVAHGDDPCACGRGLVRIGPVEGRTTETLRDGRGNAVGGLVFNILFGVMDQVAKQFQVVQRVDGSVVMRIVPQTGDRLPDANQRAIHAFAAKYLPGAPFAIEYVAEIPLTAAGKRKVVVVER